MKKRAQKKVMHKPNARHTLSEVLHSLQDMMNNELASIAEDNTGKASPNAAMTLSKEDVMNTLKALIGEATAVDSTLELLSADEIAEKMKAGTESGLQISDDQQLADLALNELDDIEDTAGGDLDYDEEIILETPGNRDKHEKPGTAAKPDAKTIAQSVDDFQLEIEEPPTREPDGVKNAKANTGKNKKHAQKTETGIDGVGEQAEINWDDIPVLHEVVAPPPKPNSTTSLEARDIAIKVAAALNIESRKKGSDAMDIKTIMRLQSLLSQELQDRQDDKNIDNENESDKKDASDGDN